MKKIRYAIIGAGTMGLEHVQNISLIKNADVVAISDIHNQSITKIKKKIKKKVLYFKNHKDLIKKNIADAYIISTPNFTHLRILKDVLKTKKHILIEKPLTVNTEECFKLKQITKNYPSIIWTAMEYRYMPPVNKFIKKIHNKAIGKLKMLSIREHRFPFLKKVKNWNRFSKLTGGTFVEKCCHFFDLMRLIVQSEPISVYASGKQDVNHADERYRGKKPDIIDNGFVIVNFKNGVRCMLDLCMFAENSDMQEELSAVGDKGKIETSVPSSQSGRTSSCIRIGIRKKKKPLTEIIKVDKKILKAGHHHGSTYYQHLAFIKAIKNKTKPEVSINDGIISVVIGQAAEKSIKEKRLVKIKELTN